jgi:D-alanyl-D-alanine carboxypeptidase (penicillin-binding protein 5/6)
MPEVDGLKTGYYRAARFNVVATAKKGDLRLIVVVLGSPKSKIRDRVAVEKFKKYFSRYTMVKVIKKGQVIDKEIVLTQGETRTLKGVAGSEFRYFVARDKQSSLKTDINLPEEIDGEIQKGQKLGELSITFEDKPVGKVDIVSPAHVLKAGIFTRLLRYFGLDY